MNIDTFRDIFIEYLTMKGIEDEEEIAGILQYLSEETAETYNDGKSMSEIINLLLYKDIVCGIKNNLVTTDQALYQLVNAVDLHLALKGYLYATMDAAKVSSNFRVISSKISDISSIEDLTSFYDFIETDSSWIPVQREYRPIYILLLVNMISLLTFDMCYAELIS